MQILPSLLKVQQQLLNTSDLTDVVNNLSPIILAELKSLGIEYVFLTSVFLEDGQQLSKNIVADQTHGQNMCKMNHQVLNLPVFLKKVEEYKAKNGGVLQRFVVFEEVELIIQTSCFNFLNLKLVVAVPIYIDGKEAGFMVLASLRGSEEITDEEKFALVAYSEIVGVAYKLQSTQGSLTQITQEVYKMNAQLHNLDKLKDDFVSVASHELRTPMTAIRSYAWMALYKSDIPLSENLKKYLSRTLISTERLINLVNDMLNISRIESGRIDITPQSFDIQSLVNDVLVEVQSKAKEKNLQLVSLNIKVPQVFGDPDKVHQVLLNLVGNALKFTPVNGTIVISYFCDGLTVEVGVKDSGVGIAKEDMARLFQKFGRLDDSYVAAATSGGTGLGLFICKKLVELMKGKIWVSSEGVGKGSTFTFSLPVATPELIQKAAEFAVKAKDGEAKTLEAPAL